MIINKINDKLFNKNKAKIIERMICEALELKNPNAGIATKYLNNRGLILDELPDNLLFHPKLKYWEKDIPDNDLYYPCLLGVITDINNEIVGIHRTFLTPFGAKASVPSPKKMMSVGNGQITGAAIRLFAAADTLALAEGIETCLAIHQDLKIPIWSTLNANGMRKVKIPTGIERISIWFDKDFSFAGEEAALELAFRLVREGRKVSLHEPPIQIPKNQGKGVDWLDVLNGGMDE